MSLASSTIPVLGPVSYSTPVTEKEVCIIQKPRRLGSCPPVELPRSAMIGDLKLTVLKRRLSTEVVKTGFASEGVLLLNSKAGDDELMMDSIISIGKKANSRVRLEGSVTEVYYTVRQTICEPHALVAA